MSDERPGSYPSPNSAQVSSGVPFYSHGAASQANDVPAMVQLSEELSRQLNSELNNTQNDDMTYPQTHPLDESMHPADPHQQMAQDAIGQLDGRPEYGEDDDDDEEASVGEDGHKSKRQKTGKEDKRQKNTRACDECRRKKVKCESEVGQDLGIEACVACRKSGLNCQFSRIPQKRGPSKGYISKLDERVQEHDQQIQQRDGRLQYLESRVQELEDIIRDYLPQAAHRIRQPERVDVAMYSPGQNGLPNPDAAPEAQAGATNNSHLDFSGNADTSSFWHPATQLPSAEAPVAKVSSADQEPSTALPAMSKGLDSDALKS